MSWLSKAPLRSQVFLSGRLNCSNCNGCSVSNGLGVVFWAIPASPSALGAVVSRIRWLRVHWAECFQATRWLPVCCAHCFHVRSSSGCTGFDAFARPNVSDMAHKFGEHLCIIMMNCCKYQQRKHIQRRWAFSTMTCTADGKINAGISNMQRR